MKTLLQRMEINQSGIFINLAIANVLENALDYAIDRPFETDGSFSMTLGILISAMSNFVKG